MRLAKRYFAAGILVMAGFVAAAVTIDTSCPGREFEGETERIWQWYPGGLGAPSGRWIDNPAYQAPPVEEAQEGGGE